MRTAKLATMTAVAALSVSLPSAPANAQVDPFIGQLTLVGFTFCPRGYADASGQLLPIASNTALFSLLGTQYGGDGRTTFALPDLRGRVPIHTGQGPGLSFYTQGQQGGTETVTLNQTQMPAHNHGADVNVSRSNATTRSPINAYIARSSSNVLLYEETTAPTGDKMNPGTVTTQAAGGNQPHANMPPYLTLRWCVATQGIFPSRN